MKDKIKRFVNRQLTRRDLLILKNKTFEDLVKEKNFYDEMLKIETESQYIPEETLEILIFSFDRALQIYSLVKSIREYVNKPVKIHVIYRSTTSEHQKSYEELISEFKDIDFVSQKDKTDFKEKLISTLKKIKTQSMFFLVDDIVFKDYVKVEDLLEHDSKRYIFSLRMGDHLKRNQPMNKEQSLPEFIESTDEKLTWIWEGKDYDWGYPLSVDGNVFSTREMILLAENTDYSAPNTFEGHIQKHLRFYSKRFGICYKSSRIVNLPINNVSTVTNNIHGNIDQESLLEKWNEGMMLDYKRFHKVNNISAHQELEVSFIKR
ncbi:MAG: hypothetical protein ACMG57_03235 [Candidatus Dojkabacteria bacterium]